MRCKLCYVQMLKRFQILEKGIMSCSFVFKRIDQKPLGKLRLHVRKVAVPLQSTPAALYTRLMSSASDVSSRAQFKHLLSQIIIENKIQPKEYPVAQPVESCITCYVLASILAWASAWREPFSTSSSSGSPQANIFDFNF
jgi:hypothetical protein